MIVWLLKTLWRQKAGVITSASSVACALVLVVVMDAAFVGESNQIVAYIDNMDADVWVMQQGVSNMHMATTYIWDWKADRVRELPGVESATPILYVNTVVESGGNNLFSYVIGLPPDGRRAGPWAMAEGESQPGPGEIILPRVFADMHGLQLGDGATIADQGYRITGFSEETFSMANSIAFVTFADLEDLISTSGTVSFILVDAQEGQDIEELAALIEREVDKVSAIPQGRFIENDYQIALLMGVEVVSFMTVIGAVLAAMIVAFTVYVQVARRKRELAIIKALGYPNRSLYLAAFIQSMIVIILALLLSLLMAVLLLPLLSALVPMITLDVTGRALMRMVVIAVSVGLLVTAIPARIIARVDPVTALKV